MSVTADAARREKNTLRESMKCFRREMSAEEKARLDQKITRRVLNAWAFRETPTLLCYVSGTLEVSTREILACALAQGKQVAVPRCLDGTREMEFRRILSLQDLHPGAFGILEPDPDATVLISDMRDSLCIVPALSFDEQGYRLGFGKGYYDRFLANYQGTSLGICYSACVRQHLPHTRFDRRVDLLMTEHQLYTNH